ncbi:HAD-hyrolase-like protein [Scopulibacillus darangshiensis]|uniref:HAD-hyrolase-like protein n=1 Tax=Scopulibacillus darangshiensis TaxID=442528 RepID=A0A4R2P4R1_9BACL|nr:HAD-hyrolase-like protein [Scopulibacillus darangshiensis]
MARLCAPTGYMHHSKVHFHEGTGLFFIGDSDADIKAGKDADVTTIGVQWLPNYQAPEFTVEPDHQFGSVADFKSYLEKSVI